MPRTHVKVGDTVYRCEIIPKKKNDSIHKYEVQLTKCWLIIGIPIRKEILPTYSETMYKHKGALETLKSELEDRIEDVETVNQLERDMNEFVNTEIETHDSVNNTDWFCDRYL